MEIELSANYRKRGDDQQSFDQSYGARVFDHLIKFVENHRDDQNVKNIQRRYRRDEIADSGCEFKIYRHRHHSRKVFRA